MNDQEVKHQLRRIDNYNALLTSFRQLSAARAALGKISGNMSEVRWVTKLTLELNSPLRGPEERKHEGVRVIEFPGITDEQLAGFLRPLVEANLERVRKEMAGV